MTLISESHYCVQACNNFGMCGTNTTAQQCAVCESFASRTAQEIATTLMRGNVSNGAALDCHMFLVHLPAVCPMLLQSRAGNLFVRLIGGLLVPWDNCLAMHRNGCWSWQKTMETCEMRDELFWHCAITHISTDLFRPPKMLHSRKHMCRPARATGKVQL